MSEHQLAAEFFRGRSSGGLDAPQEVGDDGDFGVVVVCADGVHKLQPLVTKLLGKTLYEDMRRMETAVAASGLDWTIMRPSGLFETELVTDYKLAVDYINGIFTSRTDLADSMLRQLTSDEFVRKTVAVATFAQKPSLIQLLFREARSKKASPDGVPERKLS